MTSVTNELNTASWVDKNEDLVNDSNASNTNVVTSDQDDLDESSTPSSSAPPVRKRTRATADQLSVLEDTFAVNVSPNSKLRKQLAEQLHMSERSIQIWFQNRRAKVKHMQKRAQMQMHQASIRAQLYQYQQQQQHHQQQQHYSIPPPQPPILPMQQHPFYYNTPAASAAAAAAARLAIPRAQSVDAIQHYNRIHQQPPQHLFTPPSSVPHTSYSATPPPVSLPRYFSQPAWPMNEADQVTLSRQSMPPQVYPYDFGSVEPSISGLDFPEYLHGQVSPSSSPRPDLLHQATKQAAASAAANMPTLVSVPDAGPTAVLASSYKPGASDNKYDTTKSSITEENWVASSSSPEASVPPSTTTTGVVSTVNPSHLMIPSNVVHTTPPTVTVTPSDTKQQQQQHDDDEEEPKDLYLSATTLTIGTWHRLKMHETDLVCVYRPDARIFAWHIVDGGCHFKMEVAQDAVSSIEYVMGEHDAVCDVHFDISEPPLFYMESSNQDKKKKEIPTPMWVQCSDFTEGKQASRFFRHTLKGVALHMKQELLALINDHEETRRLVHFIEPHMFPLENDQQQLLIQAGFMNQMYWNPAMPPPPPTSAEAIIPCELYMS